MRSTVVSDTFIGFRFNDLRVIEDIRVKLLCSVLIAGIAAASSGCGGQAITKLANTNTNPTPSYRSVDRAADTPTPAIEVAAPGSLATPSDTYRTACAVRRKKDVAGLKRIMSKEFIAHFTAIAEMDGKTLDEEITHMLDVEPQKKVATRNEKITGDRATIEYFLDGGGWKKLYFVKEGREWKYALAPANEVDDDSVKDQEER